MNQPDYQSLPAVALLGLGRIGAAAPAVAGHHGRPVIRNHVEAILAAGGRITALVDSSARRRTEALAKLDVPESAGINLAGSLSQLPPGSADIVTIAAPPINRQAQLAQALALGPRAVILEKPLAADPQSGAALVTAAAKAGVPLYVCYNRRTDPGMKKFVTAICFKKTRAALFRYGNGLVNYGSHAVDHILHWFGPVSAVQSAPYSGDDPELASFSFRCLLRSGLNVDVLGVPEVNYDMFEAEIYLPDRVFTLRNNGVEKAVWDVADDLYYPGYAGLREGGTQDAPQPIGGFTEMYRELFATIAGASGAMTLCTGAQALEVSRVLAAAIQSAKQNGRSVAIAAPENRDTGADHHRRAVQHTEDSANDK